MLGPFGKYEKTHKKIKNIKYDIKDIQEYLFVPSFSDVERNILVKARSRMLEGIKMNFKKNYQECLCVLKWELIHTDSQENLLICPQIKKEVNTSVIKYSYIFGSILEQKKSASVFSKS